MQTVLLIAAILQLVISVVLSTLVCVAVGVFVSYITADICVHFNEDNERDK